MSTNFTVVGGDLRIIKLAKMLSEDGNIVYTYGLEKAEELKDCENIILCDSLKEATDKSQIIVGPIPFSSNGEMVNTPFSDSQITVIELMKNVNSKVLIAGSINDEINNLANEENIKIVDIIKREELAVLNAIATAEGAIEIMIANTNRIIHGKNVLILGFGRLGKVLAKKLDGLSVNVTCAARKSDDLAWIKVYGYTSININEIGENLSEYDIIINTVPNLILTEEKLKYVRDDCLLLIDLASNPGGIDKKGCKDRGLKLVCALALPGKVAPITTAVFIKGTVYNVLREIYEK